MFVILTSSSSICEKASMQDMISHVIIVDLGRV